MSIPSPWKGVVASFKSKFGTIGPPTAEKSSLAESYALEQGLLSSTSSAVSVSVSISEGSVLPSPSASSVTLSLVSEGEEVEWSEAGEHSEDRGVEVKMPSWVREGKEGVTGVLSVEDEAEVEISGRTETESTRGRAGTGGRCSSFTWPEKANREEIRLVAPRE